MRALVNTAPGKLEMEDVPMPVPGPGQVRIRTHACGVCATDLKMLAGWDRTGYPAIPGHEWSGVVDAVGAGVDPALMGGRCVGDNILPDGGEVGFEHPGGYAQYFTTLARNIYILPDGVSLTTAILTEPLAVVLRALRRVRMENLEQALVFGDGPIGLLVLEVLRYFYDIKVYLVGGVPERMHAAVELGAEGVCAYQDADSNLAIFVKGRFGSEYPLVVEASGSLTGVEAALALAGITGQVLLVGDYDDARAGFAWNFLLHRELQIVGSNTASGAWKQAVDLLAEERLPLGRLVTHQFPLEKYPTAIDVVTKHGQGVIKAALCW